MNDEINTTIATLGTGNGSSPSGETASVGDWRQKIRFDRSFYAKIALADNSVKEYYAALATAILSYEKVRSRMSWSGVSFSAGRNSLAFIAISGKTLTLYLALSPQEYSDGKYKAKNVQTVKKHAKTPSLFRIKSRGALTSALRLIEKLAAELGLKPASEKTTVSVASFKSDTFDNLVTRGFIRIVKTKVGVGTAEPEVAVEPTYKSRAYDDTLACSDSLLSRHAVYTELMNALASGEGKVRFSRKLMLRSVDEMWVSAIERSLPAIDELIRKPSRYIEETEEVLPIELSKRVSGRSVAHLARHTDYLSVDKNGDFTPTKLLNVFREDSLMTYENKFLNTLISRLYLFIGKRRKIAEELGADEKSDALDFESSFEHANGKCRVKITVECSERNEQSAGASAFIGSGLWGRVQRLDDVFSGYMLSPFVKSMDKNFIRPPVLRTNAIIKNKYFNECLALWDFIESYDDAGYGITVKETVKDVSDEYVKQLYSFAAENYLVYLHNAGKNTGESDQSDYFVAPAVSKAEADRLEDAYEEKFTEPVLGAHTENDERDFALEVALLADEIYSERESVGKNLFDFGYTRFFPAKIRLLPPDQKQRFVDIANAMLQYDRVRMRESKRFASFRAGRKTIARIAVGGKTLKIYFAPIGAEEVDGEGNTPRFEDTPVCLRVRGSGGARKVKVYFAALAEAEGLTVAKNPPESLTAENYAEVSTEEMLARGWMIASGRKKTPASATEEKLRVGFGTVPAPESAIVARQAENLAVSESSVGMRKDETLSFAATDTNEAVAPVAPAPVSAVQALENIVHADSDYAKPTQYGIDDSSGFIRDEQQSEIIKEDEAANEERKTHN